MGQVEIAGRAVGPGAPCFVVAEAGVNHNGDMELAKKLIDEAAAAGADAVKFQAFVTEEIIVPDAPKAGYQVETTGEGGSQYPMLKALELTEAQQGELKKHCDARGVIYICTPYDNPSVDLLDRIDTAAFKIASTDTTNLPFLRYLATKKRPVILSTGMSDLAEVEAAVRTLEEAGMGDKLIILQCTSEYPAPMDQVNLRAIETMRRAFGHPVGFSDHTPGVGASPWAVPLGACMVEKHFSLSRSMEGPDHRASIEPEELALLVKTIREVEAALGDGIKRPTAAEIPNKPRMQKSVVVRRAIKAGETIKAEDLTCKRPGTGLAPKWVDRIAGRAAQMDIAADTTLALAHIDWS